MRKLNENELINLLVEANLIKDVESVTYTYINEYDNAMEVESTDGDFKIYSDYEDAKQDAIEQCEEMIEECEIPDNLLDIAYRYGFIDEDWFENYWREVHTVQAYESDIRDIASESELDELDNDEITEEEIRDNYFETLQNLIYDPTEEYMQQYGEQELYEVLRNRELVDIEELARYCVDVNGASCYLATYDHEEVEHNGYYIYRTN